MNLSIGTTPVEDVMTTQVVTVAPSDKMEDVAKVFEQNDINVAPVLNDALECVGIISSHDLAEYEAVRVEVNNEFKHGYFFDVARYGVEDMQRFPALKFNQVSFHMTKTLETTSLDAPLSRVARKMLAKHIHHVVILDGDRKLVGMVSSLDILGHLLGEPVCRNVKCGRIS